MNCETCSEPTEMRSVVRQHNRALRTIVRTLRRSVQRRAETADSLFMALCDTDPAAEEAMGELWGSAEFDCGPQDYAYMVKRSIEAVRRLNEIEAHTNSYPEAATTFSANS